jgi:hypothetical protein
LFAGEIVGLVLGSVVGGLGSNIICSFVGDYVCDENFGLLVGFAFSDEVAANKMIGNFGGVRVVISVSAVGNCVGGICGQLVGDVVGFLLGLSEELVVDKFVVVYEGLFPGEFVGISVGKLFGLVDRS